MSLRADSCVKQWELNNPHDYDKAKEGSSAISAALRRNAKAEVCFWLGTHFATFMNDMEKYFDTLDLTTVMVESVCTGFPQKQLAYALQQHMAPRVVQANGRSSMPINIRKSILAGCKYSKAITKSYGQRNFVELVEDHPDANPELFVDDTSLHASGDSYQHIRDTLVPAMCKFKRMVRILKNKLSPKAAIVASNMALAKMLKNELAQVGLKFDLAAHSRDLGISTTAGASRPNQLSKARMIKSKYRIKKISNIARLHRGARKLFSGSGFTMATWGHQASGLSELEIKALEADALSCSAIRTPGRCATISLLLAYGQQGTPRAKIVRESIRA